MVFPTRTSPLKPAVDCRPGIKAFSALIATLLLLQNPVLAGQQSFNQEGQQKLEQKDFSAALACFSRAQKAEPDSILPLTGMAQALIGLARIKQAIGLLQNALVIDQSNIQARLMLSRAFELDSNLESAEAQARKAIAYGKNDCRCYTALARVLDERGDHGGAFSNYSTALSLCPGIPEAACYVAGRFAASGLYANAVGIIEQAIDKHPEDGQLYFLAGSYLLEQDRLDEAVKAFQTSLKFDPESARSLEKLAYARGRQNKWQEALDHATAWSQKEPDNPAAYLFAAWSQINRGELKQARQTFEIAINRIKWHPELYNDYGIVLIDLNKPELAEMAFRHALKLDPAHLAARLNLSFLLSASNKPVQAQTALSSLNFIPGRSPAFAPVTAFAYARADQFEQAESFAKRILSENRRDAYARLTMAAVKEQEGDRAGRLRELFKAVHYNPDDLYLLIELAQAELDEGRYKQAYKHAQQALQISSDNERAMRILGKALLIQDNYDGALLMLKQAYFKKTSSLPLALDLAEALILSGRTEEAERVMTKAAGSAQASTKEKKYCLNMIEKILNRCAENSTIVKSGERILSRLQ